MGSLCDVVALEQTLVMLSPIGPLTMVSDGSHLLELRFGGDAQGAPDISMESQGPSSCPTLQRARSELVAYFQGSLREFSVPYKMRGTPFQQRVWRALCDVPYGATCSYSELAARIGSPRGARAVGLALGRNPLAIVVPCHRVIGANGSLTGFGGGVETKRLLLEHENRYLNPDLPSRVQRI
jgi:methylated-DNA-[protein]-cysteine S-methyltransferase